MTRIQLLAELNRNLTDHELIEFAREVLRHPLNDVRVNPRGSREEIFMALKKVPVEILVEVYEENFAEDQNDGNVEDEEEIDSDDDFEDCGEDEEE